MNEKDHIRLFDLDLGREIIAMDRDELCRFVESRVDQLRAMDKRVSFFVLPINCPTTRTPAMVFKEFFDDDPAEVRQMLINDLCYRSEPFVINYYARCGYLDHPSSVYEGSTDQFLLAASPAISSSDLLPWPEDSEAWYWARRFDLLDSDHIGLMSDSLRKYHEKLPTNEYTTQLLTLRSLSQTLLSNPDLRAAYFYH